MKSNRKLIDFFCLVVGIKIKFRARLPLINNFYYFLKMYSNLQALCFSIAKAKTNNVRIPAFILSLFDRIIFHIFFNGLKVYL